MSLNRNRGAKRAREARAEAGIGPTEPVACLLTTVEDAFGASVVAAQWPEGFAGACVPRAGGGPLLFVNAAHVAVRQRFTLAHELGHVRCGHDGTIKVDSMQTLSGGTTNEYEVQANAFASELLLPKAALVDRYATEPGLDDVVLLAAEYGVSALVALFALSGAKAVSDERRKQVRAEIEEGLHLDAYERLGPARMQDRIELLDALPYASAGLDGTALGGLLGGSLTSSEAAHAARVSPRRMSVALESLH